MMRCTELQSDQHSEIAADGTLRTQWIHVEEYWETVGPDGKVVVRDATRDDVIDSHIRSNDAFQYYRELAAARGEVARYQGTEMCGVRKVVRYETSSTWEVADTVEPLNEATVRAEAQPCSHPQDRVSGGYRGTRPFCGRCGETLPDGVRA